MSIWLSSGFILSLFLFILYSREYLNKTFVLNRISFLFFFSRMFPSLQLCTYLNIVLILLWAFSHFKGPLKHTVISTYILRCIPIYNILYMSVKKGSDSARHPLRHFWEFVLDEFFAYNVYAGRLALQTRSDIFFSDLCISTNPDFYFAE